MNSHELLDILACPACKGELHTVDGKQELHCQPCGLVFLVKEGVPVLLVDDLRSDQKAY